MRFKKMAIAAAVAALGLALSSCGHPGHNSDHHRHGHYDNGPGGDHHD